MRIVRVNTKNNPYEVVVGYDLINLKNLEDLRNKEVFLVVDENIPSDYIDSIAKKLTVVSNKFNTLRIHASEEEKSFHT